MWFVSGPVKKAMMPSSPKMNNPPPYFKGPGNTSSRDLIISSANLFHSPRFQKCFRPAPVTGAYREDVRTNGMCRKASGACLIQLAWTAWDGGMIRSSSAMMPLHDPESPLLIGHLQPKDQVAGLIPGYAWIYRFHSLDNPVFGIIICAEQRNSDRRNHRPCAR